MPPSPLLRTIHDLSALARIRGDAHDTNVLARAATLVAAHRIVSDADLLPLLESGEIDDESVRTRLRHMYEAGGWVMLESAIADLPADLRWLFESGVVTLEQLADLHATSQATAAADLGDLVRRGAIRDTASLGPDVEHAIARRLPRLRDGLPRLTLGRASSVAESVLRVLRDAPSVEWAEAAGSLRRGQETVGDVEIVVSVEDPSAALQAVLDQVDVARCLHRGPRRLYVLTDSTQVGIRCASPVSAGAVLLHATGSHAHLDQLHARAVRRGWTLDPQGLNRGGDIPPIGRTEQAVYSALDLAWVPAEIRDGGDELRAAETGTLPGLITRADIRGDLHMHTEYSDGRDTTEAMVAASAALGYEYIAITDHSPHSSASRSLSLDGVKRQADEIAALRDRYPQLAILHGVEVDILPDERLDFGDRVLERFDIVLASLHERAGQGVDALLRRYLAAMRHPLVTMITHPSNRLVPGRLGYDLDYEQFFAAAVETGTLVEIDGGPTHLDLDGALARRAVAAGAMLTVDSDSHRADALGRQMAFGIMTARRGWVEARHVMNTRPLAALRALIAGKRSR